MLHLKSLSPEKRRELLEKEKKAREKAEAVGKSGLLEIVEVRETLEDIGGLDVLKGWLLKRRDAFSRRAVEYGLPSPKGLLILGIPGTGKRFDIAVIDIIEFRDGKGVAHWGVMDMAGMMEQLGVGSPPA